MDCKATQFSHLSSLISHLSSLLLLIFLSPCYGESTQPLKGPFLGKRNMISLVGGVEFGGRGFASLGDFGIHYAQPDRFFRIPGRLVAELETFVGDYAKKTFYMFIFGVAQDIYLPIFRTGLYVGLGFGIYIRTKQGIRIGSAFTFGEKVFLGYAHNVAKGKGALSYEIFIKHYSNGSLTAINAGYNFVGGSIGYSF